MQTIMNRLLGIVLAFAVLFGGSFGLSAKIESVTPIVQAQATLFLSNTEPQIESTTEEKTEKETEQRSIFTECVNIVLSFVGIVVITYLGTMFLDFISGEQS